MIKRIGEMIRVPTDKARWYKQIVERNHEKARELHDAGHTTRAEAIHIMIDGGKCVLCKMEYKRVRVNNIFAKYDYSMPNCSCYPTCWHCGYVSIDEKLVRENLKYCPNCHVDLYESTPHSLPTASSIDRENEAAKQISERRGEVRNV